MGGEFTVQPADISLADTESSGTDTITTVAEAKTFVLGSYRSASSAGTDNTIDVKLNSSTQVALARSGTADVIDWSGFAVTMTDNTDVYRGTLTTSAASPDPAGHTSIGATVTLANVWVHTAGNAGSLAAGSHTGIESNDVPDAFCTWSFFSTTQIDCEHDTGGSESGGSVSWEVIDWEVGGAAPTVRRVMVSS